MNGRLPDALEISSFTTFLMAERKVSKESILSANCICTGALMTVLFLIDSCYCDDLLLAIELGLEFAAVDGA